MYQLFAEAYGGGKGGYGFSHACYQARPRRGVGVSLRLKALRNRRADLACATMSKEFM